MNKNILKIKDGILVGIGFILVLGIVNAASSLTATKDELLTAEKWNNLLTKVEGIFTDSNGNVGVGLSNPSAKLHIKHNGVGLKMERDLYDTYQLEQSVGLGMGIKNVTDNNIEMFFNGVGNVGIGTTNPYEKLVVSGNIVSTRSIGVTNGGTPTGQSIYSPAPNEFGISSNGVERIRIKSDGKIGIGTNNPNALLDVNGKLRISKDGFKHVSLWADFSPTGNSCNSTCGNGFCIGSISSGVSRSCSDSSVDRYCLCGGD